MIFIIDNFNSFRDNLEEFNTDKKILHTNIVSENLFRNIENQNTNVQNNSVFQKFRNITNLIDNPSNVVENKLINTEVIRNGNAKEIAKNLDVNVDMSGMNYVINNTSDIEKIIREVSSRLEKSLNSTAMGVY